MIGEVSEYELHHRARLAIKPGITGMWQVSGRSDITDFEEVVEQQEVTGIVVNYKTQLPKAMLLLVRMQSQITGAHRISF